MISKAITVGATATLLADGDESEPGQQVIVSVIAAGQTVYLGGADVTNANGLPVATGATSPPIMCDGPLYGVVASTIQAVRVLRQGG